jgi:hypothetical protein
VSNRVGLCSFQPSGGLCRSRHLPPHGHLHVDERTRRRRRHQAKIRDRLGGTAGALAIAAIIFTWATCGMGCGKSALEMSQDTLELAHDFQEEGVNVSTAELREELVADCGELTDRVARLECGRVVGERYTSRVSTIHASAETIDSLSFALWSWARAVAAKEADEDRPPVAVCEALSRVVALIDDWAAVRGSELPIEPWSCPGYEPGGEPETESAAENDAAVVATHRRPTSNRFCVRTQVAEISIPFEGVSYTFPELPNGRSLSGDRAGANSFVRNAADDDTKEENDESLVIHDSFLPSSAARAEVMS